MNAYSDVRHSVKHYMCFISFNTQVTVGRRYYYDSQFTYGKLRLTDIKKLVTWYFLLVRHCMQIIYTPDANCIVSFKNQVHPSSETLAYSNKVYIRQNFFDHDFKSTSGRRKVMAVTQLCLLVWHFCLVYKNKALMDARKKVLLGVMTKEIILSKS